MTNHRIVFTLLFAFSGIAAQGWAQYPFQANVNLVLGFPQNEFHKNVDKIGFGMEGHFAYNLPKTPVLIGASLSYLIYGSETRQEPFSTTIPDVWVDVTTTNSLVMGHLLLRLQSPARALRPYVDGLVGFHFLTTDTKIENQKNNETVAESNNFNDFTGSYGGGGGIMIQVYHTEGNESTQSREMSVYVDFGFRYLKGGKAEYLKEGSIRREKNGKVLYDVTRSTTDIVTYHLGVGFCF